MDWARDDLKGPDLTRRRGGWGSGTSRVWPDIDNWSKALFGKFGAYKMRALEALFTDLSVRPWVVNCHKAEVSCNACWAAKQGRAAWGRLPE